MTTFEYYSLIIQVCSILIIGFGLFFTGIQLMLQRRAHNENHKWNRMIAAQEALKSNNLTQISVSISNKFNTLNRKYAIPIEEVNQVISKDKSYQNSIHKLLNIYEAYARGISLGIYDEQTIKLARKGSMTRTYELFRPYIEERRKGVGIGGAYTLLEKLINRWNNEEKPFEKKVQTGNL